MSRHSIRAAAGTCDGAAAVHAGGALAVPARAAAAAAATRARVARAACATLLDATRAGFGLTSSIAKPTHGLVFAIPKFELFTLVLIYTTIITVYTYKYKYILIKKMHFFIFGGPIRVYDQVSNYDPCFYNVYWLYRWSKF